jgi:glucosamine--fructose-6-phosphate aminotransferase (isomerizing)
LPVSVERPTTRIKEALETAELGDFDHFMIKEIFEQPRALEATFAGAGDVQQMEDLFGNGASAMFDRVKNVQIVACGTSYHAGMVARYWLEELAGISCEVEVASEFRYRKRVQHEGTLLVAISQSGETADTLAALRNATEGEFIGSLVVANVDNSSLVRECDLVFLTRAGIEIGVASTKAFTTQLVALLMLTLVLGRRRGMPESRQAGNNRRPRQSAALCAPDARAQRGDTKAFGSVYSQAPRAVPRARHPVSHRDGGRAQAQGNFLHPRRSLSRR